VGTAKSEDPRIQHYHVRRVEIDTQPAMPIMADGNALGEGRVRIEVRRHVLAVMVGNSAPEAAPEAVPDLNAMEARTYAAAG
jgi:diacylglycerol kinase family enzyme